MRLVVRRDLRIEREDGSCITLKPFRCAFAREGLRDLTLAMLTGLIAGRFDAPVCAGDFRTELIIAALLGSLFGLDAPLCAGDFRTRLLLA